MLNSAEYTTLVSVTNNMPLIETPTLAYTAELEMARALFSDGDFDAVLSIVNPIVGREGVEPVTKFVACQLKSCCHSERDEWRESLNALRLVASIVDDMPAELRAKHFGQRALAHRHLNEVDDALVDYEQARVNALECGDELTVASIRNNIAGIYSHQDRADEAHKEVDEAIRIAERLGEKISLGRFLDRKAQIFNFQKRYADALTCSAKAVAFLSDHPALAEARWTHGLAMIGTGASYLEKPKSIEQFRDIHDAARLIHVELGVELLEVALKRANGHVLGAAKLLHVSHSAIIKLTQKHGLERVSRRRRNKSVIAK